MNADFAVSSPPRCTWRPLPMPRAPAILRRVEPRDLCAPSARSPPVLRHRCDRVSDRSRHRCVTRRAARHSSLAAYSRQRSRSTRRFRISAYSLRQARRACHRGFCLSKSESPWRACLVHDRVVEHTALCNMVPPELGCFEDCPVTPLFLPSSCLIIGIRRNHRLVENTRRPLSARFSCSRT